MIKAKLWPSHRSLSWTKAQHQSTSSMHNWNLSQEAALCCLSFSFAGFWHEQESWLFSKWLRLLVKSEATPVLCRGKTRDSWLADAWRPWTRAVIQCCILALSSMSPWLFHICFTQSADKAISLYAMHTYPKGLQGRLVPLSPVADGKIFTSIREPNMKLLTVVLPAL